MKKLNIRSPRLNIPDQRGFWKQIGMIIIGTTISLIFTLVAARITDSVQRAKDRKLSAMMVMSNIEAFARLMDAFGTDLAPCDSVTTWLLNRTFEELELLPDDELNNLINQATVFPFLSYDNSAEKIFSNNIDTWKNVGNVAFISSVGQCFSSMNSIQDYWNKRVTSVNDAVLQVKDHPNDYEGSSIPIKILRSDKIRRMLGSSHYMRAWFKHGAAILRCNNRKNMEAIGIPEQDVMEFTNELAILSESASDIPDFSDFVPDPINPDSLYSLRELDTRLQQLSSAK